MNLSHFLAYFIGKDAKGKKNMGELFYQNPTHFYRTLMKTAAKKGVCGQIPKMFAEKIYNYDKVMNPETSLCSELFFLIYDIDETKERKEKEQEARQAAGDVMRKIREAKCNGVYEETDMETICTKEYSNRHLKQNFGVYFIYDGSDNVIYIGKSEVYLKSRADQSRIDKRGKKVQYYFPKTKADTRLYEIYYINKYKPLHNKDAKTDDEMTVDLPEIEHSEIITVFEHYMVKEQA